MERPSSSRTLLVRPGLLEWIFLFCGLLLVLKYSWLLDDAFIYFRYIDNLLFLHIGLVYNQGEYVEGFTSPLWLLILTLFRLLHTNYWFMVRLLGCISYAVFWYLLVWINRQMSPPGIHPVNIPLVFLGLNYSVLCFFTSGMETPLVQVEACLFAMFILNPAYRWLQILIGVSSMLRSELLIPTVLCFFWGWYAIKRPPWRIAFACFLASGGWLLFRIYYYADIFPNTFYLKNIVWTEQGFAYLRDTTQPYHLYAVLILLLGCAALLKMLRPASQLELVKRLIMIVVALPVVIYVVRIGGDERHYRYLAFPFCLIGCSLAGIVENFLHAFFGRIKNGLAYAASIAAAMAVFSFYPRELDAHPLSSEPGHHIRHGIVDSVHYRNNSQLYYENWHENVNIGLLQQYAMRHKPFEYKWTEADFWCVRNYELFDVRILHNLGLTDAILAHVDIPSDRPGHKEGLRPLADDLIRIQTRSGIGRGMYEAAVRGGYAPVWIRDNLPAIEVIEKKIYNNHLPAENLKLALTFPSKITPAVPRRSIETILDLALQNRRENDTWQRPASSAGERERIFGTIPGRISVYADLYDKPVLSMELQYPARDSRLRSAVIVDSDLPFKLQRKFAASEGANRIDLSEFSGRIVKISFDSARVGKPSPPLKVLWLHPKITHIRHERAEEIFPEDAFSARHAGDSLLLILLDDVNPLDFGCYGARTDKTPSIDRFAAKSTLWESAIVQSANPPGLADEVQAIAAKLIRAGYKTALISSSPLTSRAPAEPDSFNQVFDQQASARKDSESLAGLFSRLLTEAGDHPSFLAVHLSRSNNGESMRLERSDEQIAAILNEIDSSKSSKRWIVMITGSAAPSNNGISLKDERLRVPLLVRIPDEPALKGVRMRPAVGTAEMLQMLSDLVVAKAQSDSMKSDLAAILAGKNEDERFVLSYSADPDAVIVRSRRYKLIQPGDHGDKRLYFLLDDPAESDNVINRYPVLAEFLQSQIR